VQLPPNHAALGPGGCPLGIDIAWTRETFAAMRPHFGRGRWLSYLGDDQAEDAIRAAYGPNYERLRLREVKRRYDPDNVFHLNHNIAP
jgi:FAD/FMN-containing dehydrogenase